MIYYFSTRRNDTPIRQYLRAVWPSGVVARFVPVTYEDLPRLKPRPGLYVFSDVELLDDAQRAQAVALHARLKAEPDRYRVWNDPARSARRFDVLERMAREGRNRFRAFRAGETLPGDLRYPVFVRDEHEHTGSQTPLLHNAEELDAALAGLRAGTRPTQPLLVVEWLNYGDADGVFRKYSMFRWGDTLVRKHVLFSSSWLLRTPEESARFEAPEFLAEEQAFLAGGGEGDAHDAQVRGIFEMLAIDFGRIDYTVVDDRIQVFEINTNPLALRPKQLEPGPRRPVHAAFAVRAEAAWRAGDPAAQAPWPRRFWWRMHRPKVLPIPWWRWLTPGWVSVRNLCKAIRRPALLHGRAVSYEDDRVEVSACLEWCGKKHVVKVSAPAWAGAWIDDSCDALVLAALPWAETEGVALRVRGPVSAGLLAGLRRRRWLRGKLGVAVRAETAAVRSAERRGGAVLHYTGDVFAVASAVELAEGHALYPRPELAVGGGAVPGGEEGHAFLERLGLRYADVRIERPGPEKAPGGDVDGALRLRFLGKGFGTGYLPATAAYRYAEPEAGEPDADLDPLFSGGGMRVVHHGAQRALPGTLEVLRKAGVLPPLAAARTEERAPVAMVAAGLALMRGAEAGARGNLDFGRKRVRRHALDFLRWLRAEPELAATPEGRALDGMLRQGLGLAAEAGLPKAEAQRPPLGAAMHPPDARKNRAWLPWFAGWEGGLALISDDRALVRRDLEPIASWLRLRNPRLRVGAERTLTLVRSVCKRGLGKPVWMVGLHPTPPWAIDTAESRSGRSMPKSEELAALEKTGVAVPRWRILQPGEKLKEEEFGRYVVVKPDQGLRGASVRVQKATGVSGEPIYVEAIKCSSAPLVQEFVYTGPRPVSHRVGVLFGKAIYRWRIEGREVEGRALPADGDFRASSGLSVVSSGKGCAFSDPFDAEIVAFAEKASQAFPEIPLMGIDVVRRVPDGKLFVLELNASGYCFHLTSETGTKIQKTTWLELPEQYGGYEYIADLYRLAYERAHGW
ncbi:MAG: hypothetical protein ACAH89_09990 [Rariglobus sp.]